ncbi:DUF4917 family protein [Microbacterium sp. ZW T2_14]|uniref:DUF4917 family protein n=1 Tax=Microbacterium sp. ZW T2_14 TaxID=3378079 RepID=UPI0038545AE6
MSDDRRELKGTLRATLTPVTRILTFAEAIADANRKCDSLSVLLGNGFSIAYDSTIFSYESLAEEAELAALSVPKADLFASLSSQNFEVVIDKLNAASSIQRLYGGDPVLADQMAADAVVVRNGLADVLASRHPFNALAVTDEEVRHAREFLTHFLNIYTLSYDLLLYWAVNRSEVGPFVRKRDGFEWPTWKDRSRLIWKRRPTQGPQRVYFLHGALHLFVQDRKLTKLSYNSHGSIVGELRSRLEAGEYPIVVTEGTRLEKEARIERSAYLRTALQRFGLLDGALFIHGVSMSPNDDHVLELIETESSTITALYVGIYGDPDAPSARKVIDRAKEMKRHRRESGGRPLRLRFYDVTSAHVWRD